MKKKQDKLHLLKGLKRILLDIDRAIQIIRDTEEDAEVVPNLMIGFGIDEVQAEYVADIRLRNINKEYILKRIEETSTLEQEIADLQDIVNRPERVKEIIISELVNVKKKYAVPRRTALVYEHALESSDPEEDIPDYPVNVFLSREGYFKKINPPVPAHELGAEVQGGRRVPFSPGSAAIGTSCWSLPTSSSAIRLV